MATTIQSIEKEIRLLEVDKALLFDELQKDFLDFPKLEDFLPFHKFGAITFRLMIKKRELLQLTQNIISDES